MPKCSHIKAILIYPTLLVAACTVGLGNPPARGEVLQAGITLDTVVPSLDRQLAPGNTFDQASVEKLLSKKTPENRWYQVPNWAAGCWKTTKCTNTSSRNESSSVTSFDGYEYTAKSQFSLGLIRDRRGQVWERLHDNYWTTTEYDEKVAHTLVTSMDVLESNADRITLKFSSVAFLVSKKTGEISSTQQRESLETYTEGTTRSMRCHESHRVFDWTGKPDLFSTNESNSVRTDNFENLPDMKMANGETISQLFADFLRTQKRSELIPDSATDLADTLNSIQPRTSSGKAGH